MLTAFGDGIWLSDGPHVVAAGGFHYPTRMAIIRLAEGGLFIWSPVALTDDLRRAVTSLGPVQHLIAPNALHHIFLQDWQKAWPGARVYAAPGLRQKRPDIAFDADLADAPPPEWQGQIDQVVMPGNLIVTEVVFFHAQSGTVLFTDLLQQLGPGWFSGWRALVARLDLMTGAVPQVPRKFRLAFTNRPQARSAARRILAWPAQKVVMAHGTPVEADGHAFLHRAFRWLV